MATVSSLVAKLNGINDQKKFVGRRFLDAALYSENNQRLTLGPAIYFAGGISWSNHLLKWLVDY